MTHRTCYVSSVGFKTLYASHIYINPFIRFQCYMLQDVQTVQIVILIHSFASTAHLKFNAQPLCHILYVKKQQFTVSITHTSYLVPFTYNIQYKYTYMYYVMYACTYCFLFSSSIALGNYYTVYVKMRWQKDTYDSITLLPCIQTAHVYYLQRKYTESSKSHMNETYL